MVAATIGLWRHSRRLRFLVLGAWNTLFGYGMFVLGYLLLSQWLHYLAIALLAHALAVSQAFLTQRHLVFKSANPWLRDFLRFNLTHAGTLALGMAGLALLVDVFHLHPLLAQGIVLAITVIVSYVAHSRFSFARHRPPHASSDEIEP